MRMAIFQETTAGPDSHTKWSTGGTFLSARTRSAQASLELERFSDWFAPGLPANFAFVMVEDMLHLAASPDEGVWHGVRCWIPEPRR